MQDCAGGLFTRTTKCVKCLSSSIVDYDASRHKTADCGKQMTWCRVIRELTGQQLLSRNLHAVYHHCSWVREYHIVGP